MAKSENTPPKRDDFLISEREYAFSYFKLHAEQRLRTFHFFLIIETILFGVISALAKNDSPDTFSVFLSISTVFLSFVFWKLDQRNKALVRNGEKTLKIIERKIHGNCDELHNYGIFNREEKETNKIRKDMYSFLKNIWGSNMTYSDCFNFIFLIAAVIGISTAYIFINK